MGTPIKPMLIPGGTLYMIYRDGTLMGQTHGKEKLNELFEHMKHRDSIEESIKGMMKVIEATEIRDTGRFLDYDGKELPW